MAISHQSAIPLPAHEVPLPMARVVLLVGHGSRDDAANKEFEALVDGYRALHPEIETAHCYVELARPFLSDALDSWAQSVQEILGVPSFIGVTKPLFKDAIELAARYRPNRILVVPYFLFAGRLLRQLESQVQDFSQRYP